MKLKHYIALLSVGLMPQVFAESSIKFNSLQEQRSEVVSRYVSDLQQADYKDISGLFENEGIVISTSRGKANAKEFFYAFLPQVKLAHTELHQRFINSIDNNRFAARFHLDYTLLNGEMGQGEYMDEFVFSDQSNKLIAVFMFENLKF